MVDRSAQHIDKLRALGDEEMISYLSTLSSEKKKIVLKQIEAIDLSLYQEQKCALERTISYPLLTPFASYTQHVAKEKVDVGLEKIAKGKVALIVLAGGEGSRLRYEEAKGKYPVTPILSKSLYQLLGEKIAAASSRARLDLSVAFMTSPFTHANTCSFFEKNHFFGCSPSSTLFFMQEMWPLLNLEGKLFFSAPTQIAHGPNGNGSLFKRLIDRGIWDKWAKMGIEYIQVLSIDNPLALPFDPELIGYHAGGEAECVLKIGWKREEGEKVGTLACVDGKAAIIDYGELSSVDKEKKDGKGNLLYALANLGIYSFTLPFFYQLSQSHFPLHPVKKAVKELSFTGESVMPVIPNAWKFEQFICDALPFANTVEALLSPRERCFAPLKNLRGEDSITTVQAALLTLDHLVYKDVTGVTPKQGEIFELSPTFHYPTPSLLKKWKGKPLPDQGYIYE